MNSPELLSNRRQEFLKQPGLNEAIRPRALEDIRQELGKDAKIEGARLVYKAKGKDEFTGKIVTSTTIYDSLGRIESIRSSSKGEPTTVVEFTYSHFEEVDPQTGEICLSYEQKYQLFQTATFLETNGPRRSQAQQFPIERAEIYIDPEEAKNNRIKRSKVKFFGFENDPLQDRLAGEKYKGFQAMGAAETNNRDLTASARELSAMHPSYKVIDGKNETVVEILTPDRTELSYAPVRKSCMRKHFDKQGRMVRVESYGRALRPGIDPTRFDISTYTYEHGYMTRIVQKNEQVGDIGSTYEVSHMTIGPVVIADKLKHNTGQDTPSDQLITAVSLIDDYTDSEGNTIHSIAHEKEIPYEQNLYLGFLGGKVSDETQPDGTLIRHITLPTIPQGQELVIENVGPDPDVIAIQKITQ